MSSKEEDFFEGQEENHIETVKSIFKSKTFWVNFVGFISFIVQNKYGFVIDESLQAQALMLINIILRTITKEPVVWRNDGNSKENS